MMQRRKLLLTGLSASAGAIGLAGCAGPAVQDYADQKPTLDLKTYFNGTVDAWGMFTDASGQTTKASWTKTFCIPMAKPKSAFGN